MRESLRASPLDNLVLLCRFHHRLVHQGGFDVERIADRTLEFTRPDGRVIDAHPRLPATGDPDGLRDSIIHAGNQPLDASDWTIPEGVLDLDLAVSGLLQIQARQARHLETPT